MKNKLPLIDDIFKLQATPGYREARTIFEGKAYGGESLLDSFNCALLVFISINQKQE